MDQPLQGPGPLYPAEEYLAILAKQADQIQSVIRLLLISMAK